MANIPVRLDERIFDAQCISFYVADERCKAMLGNWPEYFIVEVGRTSNPLWRRNIGRNSSAV